MTDILIMIFSTLGALFALIASIGIYKMPDFYARLSVTVKAATVGIGFILIAVSMYFVDFAVTTKSLAIIFFLIMTSPIAGFLVGRVAYLTGAKKWKGTQFDDLEKDIIAKKQELAEKNEVGCQSEKVKQSDNM